MSSAARFKFLIMKDWENGVEYTVSDALTAKDKWEDFLLKIQEAKDKMPIDETTPLIIEQLENHVQWCIETLKGDIVKLKM